MSTRHFICLAGVSGAGKDTLGDFLSRTQGFERVAIADPMKTLLQTLFQLRPEQLWGEERNVVDARLGRSPRELYQRFGQVCVELDPEVWLRPFRGQVQALLAQGRRVVCTDLRTTAEWKTARTLGADLWLVERPGAGAPGAMASHTTEREVAGASHSDFDVVLRNEGTLDDFYRKAEQALRR
ncbi:MAG: hypothetical protein ABW123_17035 [Cystobacter sp.]